MRAHFVLLGAAILCSSLSASPPAPAEEPWGLSLLDDNSFVGWDYGDEVVGWTIKNGVLRGNADASTMQSGWSLGDFELQIQWTAEEGAAITFTLPLTASGTSNAKSDRPPLQVSLREGDRCGEIVDEDVVLAGGTKLPKSNGTIHTAVVKRENASLSVTVDKLPPQEASLNPRARFGLSIASNGGVIELRSLRLLEPVGTPLLQNGNLDGWWTLGNLDSWSAEGDTLTCLNRDGNYLRTEKEYGDFTLSLEYKLAAGGNSGIGIRTPREGWPSGDGMELQLLDEPPDAPLSRHSTMALYGNVEPFARADSPEEWNRAVIRAEHGIITAWINGVLVQHIHTGYLSELRHRHPRGWIGFQDHGASISFRRMHLLESPVSHVVVYGSFEEYPRESGSEQVLDGLMNPIRLTVAELGFNAGCPDDLCSKAVSVLVHETGESVLAEQQGPGALVRLSRTGDSGRLAFYFDNESTPRIECAASEVGSRLPRVCESSSPLLTCLPFKAALRITIRDADSVAYRLDFVNFPPDVQAIASRANDELLPRGLLPAVTYRQEQFGWGTHREHDPYVRKSSERLRVLPGESAPLLSVDGHGVVIWHKLHANETLLHDDALWIEVFVDGESEPAVSAPARFLFPGLDNAENYPNFVNVLRDGFTSFLPLPFAAGIEFRVANRGNKLIEDVGLTISVIDFRNRVNAVDTFREMIPYRLRAIFQPADEAGDGVLVEAAGRGRLIGFIHEPAGDTAIESLMVDGVEQPGWAAENTDLLLGMAPGETEARRALSGRYGGLEWVYLLLTPVDFQESLVLKAPPGTKAGGRLALLYME